MLYKLIELTSLNSLEIFLVHFFTHLTFADQLYFLFSKSCLQTHLHQRMAGSPKPAYLTLTMSICPSRSMAFLTNANLTFKIFFFLKSKHLLLHYPISTFTIFSFLSFSSVTSLVDVSFSTMPFSALNWMNQRTKRRSLFCRLIATPIQGECSSSAAETVVWLAR